jgi:Zn ribbon nucleic-acid-binding protein
LDKENKITRQAAQLAENSQTADNLWTEKKLMLVKCVNCGKLFDSSFTVNDFQNLSAEQMESGTLHLCVHCGHLGLYRIRDYIETKDE